MIAALAAFCVLAALAGLASLAAPTEPVPAPIDPADVIVNPANKPLVAVLYGIAADLGRSADALQDIARTLQLATERPRPELVERIATVIEEIAPVATRGAGDVRATKPQEAT